MKVAFYKGHTRLFNKLVSWYLRGPYSHCELIFETTDEGVSVCASSSFRDGGVRFKHMVLDPDHWDVIDVEGDRVYAMRWLVEHEGDGYDIFGLIGFIWRRQSDDKHKWFCNEAVLAMLGRNDPYRFDPMSTFACLSPQEVV